MSTDFHVCCPLLKKSNSRNRPPDLFTLGYMAALYLGREAELEHHQTVSSSEEMIPQKETGCIYEE